MANEELCILAQKGNTDAENELILNLLPSLKALAARFEAQYSGLQIEKDDLLQEGTIGFLRAVHSFRPEKGNLFQTYASRVSENAILDFAGKVVCQKGRCPLWKPLKRDFLFFSNTITS